MMWWNPRGDCASEYPLNSKTPGSFGEDWPGALQTKGKHMCRLYGASAAACPHGKSSWPNTRRLAALDGERRG
jgi:hypothetical protein